MRPCFAWFARAFAWTSGCCAHMAWTEPGVLVCNSACCNTRQLSEDYLDLLEYTKSKLQERLRYSRTAPSLPTTPRAPGL
jgi:hypothetical protein